MENTMTNKCCQNQEKIRSTITHSLQQHTPLELRQKLVLQKNKRRKLWDFEHNYHCAIIGTCLSIVEVRNLLKRFQIKVNEFSDYDIHTIAVTMIENNDNRSKKINSHLDRKFKSAIVKVKKMEREELRQEWCSALKSGEVIATFWAIMTHPMADASMQKDVYGDIHMLSHLSGASNRADLKRLQTLQSEQLALHSEIKQWKTNSLKKHAEIAVMKQEISDQEKTRLFYEKKFASLQAINEKLLSLNSEKTRQQLEQKVAKLNKKISQQAHRIEQQEKRNRQLETQNQELQALQREQEDKQLNFQHETEMLQLRLLKEPQTDCADCFAKDEGLCGQCILYVGGQTNMAPHYKELIESKAGVFLHHDGGIEKNTQELTNLLNRADLVICPTNCISHNAYWQIKKSCKKQNKPCKFIPSSGLSSLSNTLSQYLEVNSLN